MASEEHGIIGPPLNPVTLAFHQRPLESEFARHFSRISLTQSRFSLLLAIALYLLFGLLDSYIVPDAASSFLLIRVVVSAVLLLVFLASFHASFVAYFQGAMAFVILVTGGGILAMIAYSDLPTGSTYYAGLMLVVMFGHGVLRLRFAYASVTTILVLLAYEYLIWVAFDTPDIIALNNTFFLLAAAILGMFASYAIEFHSRTVFWQRNILLEKQAALHAEHDRKSRELMEAREMQLSMLPGSVPNHPLLDIRAFMSTAAEVGGDYYDFITDGNGTITFTVADAAGHGARAGAMVAAMKVMFCNHAHEDDLDQFLCRTSRHLRQMGVPKIFMTAMVGRIFGNRIMVSGAGLPPALVYDYASKQIHHVDLKGIPLGTFADISSTKQVIELAPGDSVTIMTDGFVELFNPAGQMLGQEEVDAFLANAATGSADEIIRSLGEAVIRWKGNQPQNDDITFLVIKRR